MKKFFIIFCIIILDAFLLVGFLIIRDAVSLHNFNKEIEDLNKLDFKKDNFNRRIKSSGAYAKLEKTIKGYLNECSLSTKDIISYSNDEKLKNVLSYDNYEKDGPNFDNSLKYLKKSKKQFNEKNDKLLVFLDKNNVYKYGSDRIKDDSYLSLYNDIMVDGELSIKIDRHRDYLDKLKNNMNTIYDTSIDVLNFLKSNSNDWKLEDGEIKFKNQELYDSYNNMIIKIQ